MLVGFDDERVLAAQQRFRAFFGELEQHFIEREDVLTQIALALLSREHVLLTGPPGTAKSGLAHAVLSRIVDESTGKPSLFSRQFTESTVQTDLIGPINFKTLTQTGRTEHFTDEGMLGAVHAFLDEVFDGRDMLLRSALNVLHERELKQGGRVTRGAIECALMATNRYLAEVLEQSRETLLAFVDRIVYLSFVPKGFAAAESLGQVLKHRVSGTEPPRLRGLLTIQDLDALQALTESVQLSHEMCDRLVQLVQFVERELNAACKADPSFVPTRYLSTRTTVKLAQALRAICVHDRIFKRPDRPLEVSGQDFGQLRLALILSGPNRDALEQLLQAETDPRERRQLKILRTEREIFDRCYRALPPAPPPLPKTPPAVFIDLTKPPENSDTSELVQRIGELCAAPVRQTPEVEQALTSAMDELTRRAFSAGLGMGGAERASVLVVARMLHELAGELEAASGAGRAPMALWLRGRALNSIDRALEYWVDRTVSQLELLEDIDVDGADQLAHSRMAAFDDICQLKNAISAHGASGHDSNHAEAMWQRATCSLETELAVIWDGGFRAAVDAAFKKAPQDELAAVLAELEGTLALIDACDDRLRSFGGSKTGVKARVVGPRLAPLVRRTFERFDAADRLGVAAQVEAALASLKAADLHRAISAEQLLTWSAEALLRADDTAALEDQLAGARADYDRYTGFRATQTRVSTVYALVEICERLSPRAGVERDPAVSITGARATLAGLPAQLQQAIVDGDLDRIQLPVTLLESWWDAIKQELEVTQGLRERLRVLAHSRFFDVLVEDSALSRFALELDLVIELFPSAETRSHELKQRVTQLMTESHALSHAILEEHSKRAWRELLEPDSRS